MNNNMKQTPLFLGATGGCALNILIHTLNAGHHAVAVARTPDKLTGMLREQGLDDTTIAKLHIIKGNATGISVMKTALTANQPAGQSVAPLIICGIGSTPRLRASITEPVTADQPSLCADTVATVLSALKELSEEKPEAFTKPETKPNFVFLSTTGVSQPSGPEDVPFGFRFAYHHLLRVAHIDKRNAENNLAADLSSPNPQLRAAIIVRLSLLQGTAALNEAKPSEKVRVGVEQAPAVGYTIPRANVGRWVFDEVVRAYDEGKECRWEGEKVTLTC